MTEDEALNDMKKLLWWFQEQARKKTAQAGFAVRQADELEKAIKELEKKKMEKK